MLNTYSLDIGSKKPDAIYQAVDLLTKGEIVEILVLFKGDEKKMEFKKTSLSLKDAFQDIKNEQLSSLLIFVKSKINEFPVKMINVFEPSFADSKLKLWQANFDLEVSDIENLMKKLMEVNHLKFISISDDDGISVEEQEDVSVDNFPWLNPGLIEATVEGITRKGLAWKESANYTKIE